MLLRISGYQTTWGLWSSCLHPLSARLEHAPPHPVCVVLGIWPRAWCMLRISLCSHHHLHEGTGCGGKQTIQDRWMGKWIRQLLDKWIINIIVGLLSVFSSFWHLRKTEWRESFLLLLKAQMQVLKLTSHAFTTACNFSTRISDTFFCPPSGPTHTRHSVTRCTPAYT